MTEKLFIIDFEEIHQKNAIWEFDKSINDYEFVCFEDDTDEYLIKINELAEENKELKSEIQTQKQIIAKQEMKLAEYNNQINVSTN